MSFFDEVATWGMRLFQLLPEIMSLWSAVKEGEPKGRLDAQLALERKIFDMQVKEEIK